MISTRQKQTNGQEARVPRHCLGEQTLQCCGSRQPRAPKWRRPHYSIVFAGAALRRRLISSFLFLSLSINILTGMGMSLSCFLTIGHTGSSKLSTQEHGDSVTFHFEKARVPDRKGVSQSLYLLRRVSRPYQDGRECTVARSSCNQDTLERGLAEQGQWLGASQRANKARQD